MVLSTSEIPAHSVDLPGELQSRLARFARVIFVISGGMVLASVALDVASGGELAYTHSQRQVAHIGAVILLFGAWRYCKGPPRSLRALEALDATLTVSLCCAWAMLAWGVDPSGPIEFSIILALTHTLVGRSVLVPSSFRRSLVINTVSSIPIVAVIAQRGMSFIAGATPARVRVFLVFVVLWCIVAIVTSAMNSR